MTAKSYPKPCRMAARGASIGMRTKSSPSKYACHETRCYLTLYSVEFKRVPCPTELTSKTQCIRDDEKQLIAGITSSTATLFPSPMVFSLAIIAGVLLV